MELYLCNPRKQSQQLNLPVLTARYLTSEWAVARMAAAQEPPNNGMVFMCTGLEERAQNELYLMVTEMKGLLVRDKVAGSLYDTRTSHLVVGATMARTDKLLCALAAGVPVVRADYIRRSREGGTWLPVEGYDVGREEEQGVGRDRLYVPPLPVRQAMRRQGGVFQGWKVVVLLEDPKRKEVYRKMLEMGGAVVHRWTLQHLQDLQEQQSRELASVKLILARPGQLLQPAFAQFVSVNDRGAKVSVVCPTYIGDFLTKKQMPVVTMYDVRNPDMWALVEEGWMVEQLEGLGLGWSPGGPPSLQENSQGVEQEESPGYLDLASPDYSGDEVVEVGAAEDTPGKRPGRPARGPVAKRARTVSDETDEIEIVSESISSPSRQPSSSGMARLRARAAELRGQTPGQATLDTWVTRPPAAPLPTSPDSPEQQAPPDAPDALPSPIRRQPNPPPAANHFLGLRRSGSTRSARSLFAPEHISCSQDSLSSDPAEAAVMDLVERGEGPRARAQYSHNLQVVRRSRAVGVEVGEEGPVRRLRDGHQLAGEVEAEPVTAAMCQTM